MVELWSVKTLVCFYYQSYCHFQSSTGQTILRDFAHTCNLLSSSLLIWKSQISLMLKAPQSEIIIVIHYICLRSAVCCTLSLSLCLLPATDYVSGPGLRWWEAPSLPAAPSLSLICSSRCLSLSLVCPSLCLASFKLCLCSVGGRRPNVWVLTCPDLHPLPYPTVSHFPPDKAEDWQMQLWKCTAGFLIKKKKRRDTVSDNSTFCSQPFNG